VAPWASVLVFDTLVFVLTLYRRLVVGRTLEHGLFALMLRDGIIFYGVLLALYVSNVLTLLVAEVGGDPFIFKTFLIHQS